MRRLRWSPIRVRSSHPPDNQPEVTLFCSLPRASPSLSPPPIFAVVKICKNFNVSAESLGEDVSFIETLQVRSSHAGSEQLRWPQLLTMAFWQK